MRIALVHDYLTQLGGAERVFELLCQYVPQGDIFTSVYDPDNTISLEGRPVNTTFLQKIPAASKKFRMFAPFYYPAFRSLNLQDYDLILSSSASFAKGVRKNPQATHICFCHNITRFLWNTKTYLNQNTAFRPFEALINPVFDYLRAADLRYAKEPDLYIANSSIVAKRIQDTYNQPAMMVNYPIDSRQFQFNDKKSDFFLVASRLISYKRIDIIVEAFNWLGWPVVITGEGPERERLEAMALDNVQFLGHVSDAKRRDLMSSAQGVIIAALEDYGLTPIEANFSGTPVIAYGAGGVLDTQVPGHTGVLFKRQTPESVYEALLEAGRTDWDYKAIREHALNNFTEPVFFRKIQTILESQGFNDVLQFPSTQAAIATA
ncbi:glycosyltransferase [Leptothoe sp. ISB3NOV94-8A]